MEDLAHGRSDIPLQFRFRHARCLKVLDVEVMDTPGFQGAQGIHRVGRREGNAHADHRPEQVWPHQGGAPGHHGAPVVADDDRLPFPQGADQFHHVADQVQPGIGLHRCRGIRAAVAAHIRGCRPEAGGCQRTQLVPPGIPQLRETMAQQHQGALSLNGHAHLQAVDDQGVQLQVAHGAALFRPARPSASADSTQPVAWRRSVPGAAPGAPCPPAAHRVSRSSSDTGGS
ncbi:hypothetical protein D9M68_494600 [compost metagenome]